MTLTHFVSTSKVIALARAIGLQDNPETWPDWLWQMFLSSPSDRVMQELRRQYQERSLA